MPKREDDQQRSSSFVVLFTSLSVLVLSFFIYLSSVSTIDESKHREAYGSLLGAFGFVESRLFIDTGDELLKALHKKADSPLKLKKHKEEEEFRKLVKAEKLTELVDVKKRGQDLVIRLQEEALFEPGSADILPSAYPILKFVGKWIKVRRLKVSIEGHTDDVPISSPEFPSNWELSAARAVAVLKFLVERAGVPQELLSARAFGPYRPIADNSTPEGRAKNRRVEIILMGAEKRYSRPGFWNWFDSTED